MNNDVLYVRGIDIEKMIFRVFDRWGEMVFESTNIDIGDGTFRGVQLQLMSTTTIRCHLRWRLKFNSKGNVTLMIE